MIIGKAFGDYRIIGRTYLGESRPVYKAVNQQERQTCFLKILNGLLIPENPLQREFLDRLSIAGTILHPGIARTYPIVNLDKFSLIPLEFTHGQALSIRISSGQSNLDFVQRVAIQAARALAAAHSAGMTHGRLTANCILMTALGELKILDFVLSYLPSDIELVNSDDERFEPRLALLKPPLSKVAYQSPEQVKGAKPGVASDLFSLGIILYELLVGEFLFIGDKVEDLNRQILVRELPELSKVRHDVSTGWSRLLRTLLNKDPADRYPTANALLTDLEKLNQGHSLNHPSFRFKNSSISRRSFFRRFMGDKFD